MSKELDEFYKSYSARIIAIDDTPSVEVMDGGKFKLLSIEEYEEMTNKIADLQSQLAEKEKEIESLKHFKVTIGTMETNQVDISSTTYIDQDKISFCIEQLEKVKKFTEKEIKECNKLLQEEFEDDYYIQSVNARQSMCYEFKREIDNQIKAIKREK